MNKVELQGKLARDCHVTDTKKGGKMVFMVVRATRDGGTDYVPVKAFEVSETILYALKEGADIHILGRFQSGRYNKESKTQEYNNTVIADEIRCGGVGHSGGIIWGPSAVTTASAFHASPDTAA